MEETPKRRHDIFTAPVNPHNGHSRSQQHFLGPDLGGRPYVDLMENEKSQRIDVNLFLQATTTASSPRASRMAASSSPATP